MENLPGAAGSANDVSYHSNVNQCNNKNDNELRKKKSSIIVLKPKYTKRGLKKSLNSTCQKQVESIDENHSGSIKYLHHLHPVKIGRYKLNKEDRDKFVRMKKDGQTSLAIALQSSDKSVLKLGQVIGKKYVKPTPIQIITIESLKQLEALRETDQSEVSAITVDCETRDHNLTMINLDQCSVPSWKDPINSGHQSVIDFSQLRTLQNLGIDVGFIDYYQREFLLESSGKLLLDLMKEQHRRLSSLERGQSYREKSLANSVSSLLTYLCKTFAPGDLTSTSAIHNILGINA